MTTGATLTVRRLCDSAARLEHESATDGQLLRRFLDRRDEAAFAVLLRRHGPMVLGVCRRILRDHHDADDAFQVTFFVLVRKASALAGRRTIGDWLYGVAYHTALKTRAASVKRREKERHARPAIPSHHEVERDLLPLLDRELNRLPEKFRTPLVLCELEGRSRKDVAALLGIPEGTLSSRLAAAKKRLARRLAHLGVPAAGATLTAALADAATAAPPALLDTTTEAAALFAAAGHAGLIPPKLILLTEGVMKSMLLAKLKVAAGAVLVAGTIALTAAGFTGRAAQADPPAVANRDEPKKPADSPTPVPVPPKTFDDVTRPKADDAPGPKAVADVRGTVTGVEGAIAAVSIGTDHGVDKGTILDVFRLAPKPVYLGTLRVTAAREHDAIGTFAPADKTAAVRKGDSVSTPPAAVPPTIKVPVDPPAGAPPAGDDFKPLNADLGVQGKVTAVQDSLATVSIGADDGINKDSILYVFRLQPRPTYVGTLQVLTTRQRDAVGLFKPAGRTAKIEKGDHVATKVFGAPPELTTAERTAVTQKAIDSAKALPAKDPDIIKRKCRLLDFIARNQAKGGDRDGAAKTFQLAVEAAKSLNELNKDESETWWLLMQISNAQADAGLLAAALRTVDEVASANPKLAGHAQQQKDTMRYFIVQSLAKAGHVVEAKDLLETIKITERDTTARDQSLLAVADGQIKQKDYAGAQETLGAIRSWGFRRQGYGALVTALARAGERDAARKVVQILRKEMDRFRDDEPSLAGWVVEVAQAQGMIGDVKEAQEWIDKLKSPELKAEAQFALLNGVAFAPRTKRK
jgi:RNA polymerase sigma factor (sigma-70 family)